MAQGQLIVDPGKLGYQPDHDVRRCFASEAITKGQHVMLDLQFTDTTNVLNFTPGDPNSCFSWVRLVDASGGAAQSQPLFSVVLVALEDVASGASGLFQIAGLVEADVPTATVRGDALVAGTAGTLVLATGATGQKIVAIAMETEPGAGGVGKAFVWLKGEDGFGTDGDTV